MRTIFKPSPSQARTATGNLRPLRYPLSERKRDRTASAGMPVSSLAQCEAAARELLRRGAGTVILTLGERGSLVVTPHSADHVPVQLVRAVDTTGAGDAYVGSLAYFLAAGLPLSESARKASAVATRSVLKPGTQTSFPDRGELADILGTGP